MDFKEVRLDLCVIDFLGELPAATQKCLVGAFEKIRKEGFAVLSPDSILAHLHAAEYCDYTILVSVNENRAIVVIIDVVPPRNALSGILIK